MPRCHRNGFHQGFLHWTICLAGKVFSAEAPSSFPVQPVQGKRAWPLILQTKPASEKKSVSISHLKNRHSRSCEIWSLSASTLKSISIAAFYRCTPHDRH